MDLDNEYIAVVCMDDVNDNDVINMNRRGHWCVCKTCGASVCHEGAIKRKWNAINDDGLLTPLTADNSLVVKEWNLWCICDKSCANNYKPKLLIANPRQVKK